MRFLGQRGTKPGVVEEYLPVCFSPRNKEGKKQMKKRYRNRRNGNGVRRIRERKERTGMEPDDASGACSPRMAVAERSPRPPPLICCSFFCLPILPMHIPHPDMPAYPGPRRNIASCLILPPRSFAPRMVWRPAECAFWEGDMDSCRLWKNQSANVWSI